MTSATFKRNAKRIKDAIAAKTEPKQTTSIAGAVGGTKLFIGGQIFPGSITGTQEVVNAGRPAAASYVAKNGGGGGSVSVSSGGGAASVLPTTVYLPRDGSLSMTGSLDMGENSIINVQRVDGRDLQADGVILDGMKNADVLVLTANADYTNERVLTFSAAFTTVDSGANNAYTVSIVTPPTLSVSSTNNGTTRSHAITTSSNPGAAASILASSAAGMLTLPTFTASTKVRTPLLDTASGNMTIQPAGNLIIRAGVGVSPIALIPFERDAVSETRIGSDDYASQTTGWAIEHYGGGDFRYLYTDEMHAKVFIADLEQALAGGQIIAKSVTLLFLVFTAPAAGGTTTLTVRDLPSATGMAVFQNGDMIRLRNFSRAGGSLDISDCWGIATLDTSYGTGGFDSTTKSQRYTFVRSSGSYAGHMTTGTTVQPESIVLDYGISGNGYYEVNAIDGYYAANSPYAQIVTWTVHPAATAPGTGLKIKARLGNLVGITDVNLNPTGYGLYSENTYLKGDFLTGDGVIRMYNATGINILQDVWSSWDNKRAVQWWPDITSVSGDPSLSIYTGKVVGGFTANQNFSYIDANPTGNVLAGLSLSAFGQGTASDAIVYIEGGSQSLGTTPTITLTATTIEAVGTLAITGNITVTGTVDGVDISAFKATYDSHTHDSTYLKLIGGTLTGTLTSRTVAPSANNTYDIGTTGNYFNYAYIRNLVVDTVVGTPTYSHTHAAGDITSGTLASARIPDLYVLTAGDTMSGALVIDADTGTTSNYVRWLTQTSTGKAWDMIGRAHDYATSAQQNDLLLTYYDGATIYVALQFDSGTRVADFLNTPTVAGTAVSLSTHNHDAAYVPVARTVTAGAGLTGGGSLSANITISHNDTSTQASVTNTTSLIRDVTLDTYGHVTALVSATVLSIAPELHLGASSTAGTLDWNDVSNTKPNSGSTLLRGTAANAMGGLGYYHPINFEYATKNGTGNVTQWAVPYSNDSLNSGFYYRGRFSGTWSSWYKMWSETNDGHGSGLDADTVDTIQGASIVQITRLVSAGSGLTGGGALSADITLSLATPGSLTVSTTNSAAAHTHAITSSAAPGAAASLLASSGAGMLTLPTFTATTKVTTPLIDTASGNLTLTPAGGTVTVTGAGTFTTKVTSPLIDTASGDLQLLPAGGRVGINRVPSGAALDVIADNNADHTQRIKQKSGQTGRLWRIEDTTSNELIVLDSVGNLQSGSPGFASGLTGWQITPWGKAEFNDVWVRGELHASIFVMDEFHASGGTLFVSPAGKLENDAIINVTTGIESIMDIRTTSASGSGTQVTIRTTSASGSGTQITARWIGNYFDITDPPSGHAMIFQPGDVIRCKALGMGVGIDLWDIWGTITAIEDVTDYYRYFFTRENGGSQGVVIPSGTAIVSYGAEGDGRILITADQNYAPYIDIFTSGKKPWIGEIVPHVRQGRLDGVGLPGVSGVEQYGMVGSTNLANANSPYFIMSNLQMAMYKINSRWNDGANDTVQIEANGRVRFGTNIGQSATTGFDFEPSTGDLTIGSPSYAGNVTIYGQIFLPDGSPAGVVWRGAWAATTNYEKNDTVSNGGKSYICILAHTSGGSFPGIGANWDLIADQGTTGSTGSTGATGSPGATGATGPAGADNQDFPFLEANSAAMVGKAAGLYMINTHLGYWNGTSFNAYIDNGGNFRFGQSGSAYVGFDASTGLLLGKDSSSVTQWYASSTDGKFRAGAGAIVIDRGGIHVANSGVSNGIVMYNIDTFTNANKAGRLWALSDLGRQVYLTAGRSTGDSDATNATGILSLFAYNGSGNPGAGLVLTGGTGIISVTGDLDINGYDIIEANNMVGVRTTAW